MRIAVLDNDHDQTRRVCEVMQSVRHDCTPIHGEESASEFLRQHDCDLLILDLEAPVMSRHGLAIVQEVRLQAPDLPVLLLASRSNEDGIVAAMTAGASDYLVKPIRRGELQTRVQALLKRAYPSRIESTHLEYGAFRFETDARRITLSGKPIEVTQKEFELALLFFRHLGRPLSRVFIREAIWSSEEDVPSRTIDTHVSRVRTKLGLRPENGYRLVPVYSFGYKLESVGK